MARTADLLTVLHDIDAYRGRICATCHHYVLRGQLPTQFRPPGQCRRGYRPAGADDSCDDWEQKLDNGSVCRNVLK